ncbi:MAG: TIGR03960 family B12-binding radical SAM protein [Desulfobacterales bacterium]|nr:TIGR03960 family B12-binding radical SAM protein [Desulfobacterales bacterium]
MQTKTIQDLLPLVEQPSRYLGREFNTITKDYNKVDLSIVLAFPDLYEIGTSHFGLQILYHILNSHKKIAAERVFAPADDMAALLKSSSVPLSTLETAKPLTDFDIIGFSLLYELNFTNILLILDLAGIPFLATERDDSFPVIIAGGPCTSNPEPVADFFDAMVIGDGEQVIVDMADVWLEWKKSASGSRVDLLKAWSNIRGVYIPSFFTPSYDENGFQTVTPQNESYGKVKRAIVSDLNNISFPDRPIIPFGKPVHDRLRLEVSRGCTRGCRFCQAGMIYRPTRERSMKTLLDITERSMLTTGYEDISLLSLSTGDYGCINSLMEALMNRFEKEHTAVSLPSLRAGTLTPELMEYIKKVRKTGFTVAPEAGSQRLRDVINKNITEEDIFKTIQDAFDLGWQLIKLYFMVGQPTEVQEDLDATVDLVMALWKIKGPKGRKLKLNVSFTTLIPKSHTPFQWDPQISLEESRDKISFFKEALRKPGIKVKWQDPEVSWLEGLWARGDRRLSELLMTAYNKGCRFDGWSDHFNFDLWQEAFVETKTNINFYTTRKRAMDEPLPWDHIDSGVSKTFLKEERVKAEKGKTTADCRFGECMGCDVCDFKTIEPKVFDDPGPSGKTSPAEIRPIESVYKKVKVSYARTGQAKYFGHLEQMRLFLRAIRRSGFSVKYSKGFHPMPKISFHNPLPIGMESEEEHFFITVTDDIKPLDIKESLNKQLPEGLNITACCLALSKSDRLESDIASYRITLKGVVFDEEKLKAFFESDDVTISRKNKKGKLIKLNLKDMITDIKLVDPQVLLMTIKPENEKSVRPTEAILRIFDVPEKDIRLSEIVKLKVS